MKQTAVSDKEATSWSLSWQPEGCCNTFNREAILASAPPRSGVYGLFNHDCQIFIGASINIRDTLLRHENETDFQSQHLRPTGFTYEICAVELCKSKVDELTAKFRPVLQTEVSLTESWTLSNNPNVSEPSQDDEASKISTDRHEFPIHEIERQSKVRRRFQFNRLGTLVAAIIIASALVMFYFGLPADYALQKRANGANPAPAQTEIASRPQQVASIDAAHGLPKQSAKPAPAKVSVHASASGPNTAPRLVKTSTPTADRAVTQTKTGPLAHPAGRANSSKKWSVQISATPAKEVADSLAQQLKGKGYDSYLVQTEVKGQTYYRVRVGHFGAREEAEGLRQSLARQEGYRDAYLAGD